MVIRAEYYSFHDKQGKGSDILSLTMTKHALALEMNSRSCKMGLMNPV
jgi:hypothetical protein